MIRGKTRELPKVHSYDYNIKTGLHNRFDIEVIDSHTGSLKQKAYAENVICDFTFDYICDTTRTQPWNYYIACGDGTGVPSSSDTSLFHQLCYSASTVYNVNWNPETNVYMVTKKAVFDETVAAGTNWTEVGILGPSNLALCTHAMLKDMNGNTVSIMKTDTDIINVYATVFCNFIVPNNFIRLFGVHQMGWYYQGSGSLSTTTSYNIYNHITGLATIHDTKSSPGRERCKLIPGYGYVPGTTSYDMTEVADKQSRTITLSKRLSAPDVNIGGIKSLFIGFMAGPDMALDIDIGNGWYEKTPIRGESIGTGDGSTVDFSTSFSYATNATIYVDGEPVSATVEYGDKFKSIGHYMKLIEQPAYGWGYSTDQVGVLNYDGKSLRLATVNLSSPDSLTLAERKPIFENILHETVGIQSIYTYALVASVSNDLKNWVQIFDGALSWQTLTIPEQYQNYRYWRLSNGLKSGRNYPLGCSVRFTANAPLPTETNIHLSTPPADGAVITADYDTITVGKDANHVFDFSISFQFGEYKEV